MIIKRENYLNQLITSRHNGLVKIITGLRRSGKSFKKIIIVKDYIEPKRNQESIVTVGLIDFLLKPEILQSL